jgi:hypothetical protein
MAFIIVPDGTGDFRSTVQLGNNAAAQTFRSRVREPTRTSVRNGFGLCPRPQLSFEIWLRFAIELGAITEAERNRLQRRGEKTLDELAVLQAPYHRNNDPAVRFLFLLQTALASGGAHVADRRGRAPDLSERWGWPKLRGRASVPQGKRIGWVAGSELFLEPAASYEVAQQMAGTERLPVSAQTLRRRLREHGLLTSVDVGREMLLVRRTLDGTTRQVLHMKTQDLLR